MRLQAKNVVLDKARREVTVEGRIVTMSPKAFLLLEQLMKAAPAARSKAEIYGELWGDTFVEEANIPNLVSEIRAALGDNPVEPAYIRTVRGYGYLFLVEPTVIGGEEGNSPFLITWRSREYPLSRGRNLIGRDPEATVVVDWGGVSRRHAVITIDQNNASIEDLGSKNGTYVGPQKITEATQLQAGDIIHLGSVSLSFRRRSQTEETFTEAGVEPSKTLDDT